MFRCIYGIHTAGNFVLAVINMVFQRKEFIYVQVKKFCGFYLFKFLIVDREHSSVKLGHFTNNIYLVFVGLTYN